MPNIIKLVAEASAFDKAVLAATCYLKQGKIIAVPSDTIYGIAALTQCDEAVNSIYRLKGRDTTKPLSICVSAVKDIPKWGKIQFPKSLLYDLFPGPVTIVLERQPVLNPNLNPNVSTVGIRIPKNKFIVDLAASCDEPLAMTSANISTKMSTLSVEEFSEIWPFLDLIVDGGILGHQNPYRLGSTIVDLSEKGFYKVIREGCALERTKAILCRYNLKEQI